MSQIVTSSNQAGIHFLCSDEFLLSSICFFCHVFFSLTQGLHIYSRVNKQILLPTLSVNDLNSFLFKKTEFQDE